MSPTSYRTAPPRDETCIVMHNRPDVKEIIPFLKNLRRFCIQEHVHDRRPGAGITGRIIGNCRNRIVALGQVYFVRESAPFIGLDRPWTALFTNTTTFAPGFALPATVTWGTLVTGDNGFSVAGPGGVVSSTTVTTSGFASLSARSTAVAVMIVFPSVRFRQGSVRTLRSLPVNIKRLPERAPCDVPWNVPLISQKMCEAARK